MKSTINGVPRRSGRYPWGTNPDKVIKTNILCDLCGESFIVYCVDGHIPQPHWCESCALKIASEYVKEKENGTSR